MQSHSRRALPLGVLLSRDSGHQISVNKILVLLILSRILQYPFFYFFSPSYSIVIPPSSLDNRHDELPSTNPSTRAVQVPGPCLAFFPLLISVSPPHPIPPPSMATSSSVPVFLFLRTHPPSPHTPPPPFLPLLPLPSPRPLPVPLPPSDLIPPPLPSIPRSHKHPPCR